MTMVIIIILKVHDPKYIKFNCTVNNGQCLNDYESFVIIIAYRHQIYKKEVGLREMLNNDIGLLPYVLLTIFYTLTTALQLICNIKFELRI
jgi:hypothetical protein